MIEDKNMDIVRFESKSKKSFAFYIVSIMVLLFAVIWLQYFIFGSIVLGGIIFFAFSSAFEIDFKNRKYRNVKYLGTVSFGKWIDLPDVEYVSVFRATMVSSVRGLSNTKISNKEKVIVINLIHNRNQRLKVMQAVDIDDAFANASIISEKLNVKLFDATGGKGKWVD